MSKYALKAAVVTAEQFTIFENPTPAHAGHVPEGMHLWPDKDGFQPRDMSFGYVDIEDVAYGGLQRIHLMPGDWIVTIQDGGQFVVSAKDFAARYQEVG